MWEVHMKRGVKIGIIAGASAVILALIGFAVFVMIKTSSFKDSIENFEAGANDLESARAYLDEFKTLRNDAVSASGSFKFWTYDDYTEQFDVLIEKAKTAQKKTDAYLKKLSDLKLRFSKLFSLGKYRDTFDSSVKKADEIAQDYDLDKYEDSLQSLEKLLKDATVMNEKLAKYISEYKGYNDKYEAHKYILGDYADDYKSAKEAATTALNNFDEQQAAVAVPEYGQIVDKIIKQTDSIISSYKEDVDYYLDHAAYSDYTDFDMSKINEYYEGFRNALNSENYALMEAQYKLLGSWIEQTDYALYSDSDSTLKWVQTDVSDNDTVKLYLSSAADDSYSLKIEDFVIYEQDGSVWDERKATDLSQIRGSMSMDLVVDISSSMYYDFYPMQLAVESFINSTSSDTALGLSTIGTIYERYQSMTKNKDAIRNSLWSLYCEGLTSLYQSLYSSVVYTASQTGSRCVVAFTDGDNVPYGTGYDYSAQDVIDVSLYYQVPVYIIGIGSAVNSSTLRNIANSTGGMYFENIGVNDLSSVYSQIYEKVGKLYELTYTTDIENNRSREIYLRYNDYNSGIHTRITGELDASTLQDAYHSATLDGSDLTAFYSETAYLSSDDLLKLGDSLEKVQTIINIYFGRFGYKFNNEDMYNQMLRLGVITQNGTLGNDETLERIKLNHVCYQNLSALFNFRYELVYKVAAQCYASDPYISYEDMKLAVHNYYGESNKNRFSYDVKAAWNALH